MSRKTLENSWKDKVPEMRYGGMTYSQVADALSMDKAIVRSFCRSHGLKYSDLGQPQPVSHHVPHNKGIDAINWDDKVSEKTKGKFRLLSSEILNTSERSLTIECVTCGFVKTVSSISIRARKGIRCNACSFMETKRLQEEREKEERYRREENRRLRQVYKSRNLRQMEMRFCGCGQLIAWDKRRCDRCQMMTDRERKREEARRARLRNPEAARIKDRRKEHKRRLRIESNGFDKTVDLNTLYKRDHGICYICGKVCDWSDFQKIDGNFIVGGTYPTVEHVKPLCNGGTHTWDNVKLACFACNTKKGRKSLDEIALTGQR